MNKRRSHLQKQKRPIIQVDLFRSVSDNIEEVEASFEEWKAVHTELDLHVPLFLKAAHFSRNKNLKNLEISYSRLRKDLRPHELAPREKMTICIDLEVEFGKAALELLRNSKQFPAIKYEKYGDHDGSKCGDLYVLIRFID